LPIQIAISRDTLKGVMPTANATEYALIQTLFEPYFNESVRPTVFKRQLLTQLAHRRRAQQSMSLVDLAKENNLSQTSFKRRLSEQGSSFNEIKTAFLAAEASLLLRAGGASFTSDDLETVSNQLGYGSLSAFSRAFKQWYGISPLKFRQLSSAAKP
jgi:AraC-like DNA-binding protein